MLIHVNEAFSEKLRHSFMLIRPVAGSAWGHFSSISDPF